MLDKVKKRDGRVVSFDKGKITAAIFKAAQSVGGTDISVAKKLAELVEEDLSNIKGIPSVEEIQDTIEKILIEQGHAKTAKAYIVYRQQRAELRREKQLVLEKEEVDEVK